MGNALPLLKKGGGTNYVLSTVKNCLDAGFFSDRFGDFIEVNPFMHNGHTLKHVPLDVLRKNVFKNLENYQENTPVVLFFKDV